MSEPQPAGYVVKAMGRTGTVCWLSAANEAGFRTLATRKMAAVFQTAADAHDAIDNLSPAFEEIGLIFYVERAD